MVSLVMRRSLVARLAILVVFAAVALHLLRKHYLAGGHCQSAARLDGRTVLITGASSGIGLETAVVLVARGARLIMPCRCPRRGQRAVAEILRRAGREHEAPSPVVLHRLDLASLASVRAFADRILREEKRLDVLINNAGGMSMSFGVTKDGFETTWQVNHLSHFLLTHLLLDILKGSAGHARIVHLSSLAHRWADTEWATRLPLTAQAARYAMGPAYWQSKLAAALFSNELAVRLRSQGVTSNAVHPGVVDSELYRDFPSFVQPVLRRLFALVFKTSAEGAQTSVCAAVSPAFAAVTGEYMADCAVQLPSASACNLSVARELWQLSERQLGIQFNP